MPAFFKSFLKCISLTVILICLSYLVNNIVNPLQTWAQTSHCNPRGDINCSGTVNALDLKSSLKLYLGNTQQTSYNTEADLNDSGNINSMDMAPIVWSMQNAIPIPQPSLFPENCATLGRMLELFPQSTCMSSDYNSLINYNSLIDLNKDRYVNAQDKTLYEQHKTDDNWCRQKINDAFDPCQTLQYEQACSDVKKRMYMSWKTSCGQDGYDPVADINLDKSINEEDRLHLFNINGSRPAQERCQQLLESPNNACEFVICPASEKNSAGACLPNNIDIMESNNITSVKDEDILRWFCTQNDESRYDFVFLLDSANIGTHYGPLSNDIKGIGQPFYNGLVYFGCDSQRLRGFYRQHLFAFKDSHTIPPSVLAGHELFHSWLFNLDKHDPATTGLPRLATYGHYSECVGLGVTDVGGGNRNWTDNGNGTFTIGNNDEGISDLSLYLSGFASPEEVRPFFVIENPNVPQNQPYPVCSITGREGETISGTKKTVTIQQIIQQYTPRNPSSVLSRKVFNIGVVLLVDNKNNITYADMIKIRGLLQTAPEWFNLHTWGRGVINFPIHL